MTSVIIGAKRLEQLQDNLAADELTLTQDELRQLDDVSALPPEYPEVAEAIELNLEYAPAPPFGAGRPETAPAAAAQTVRKRIALIVKERRKLAEAAAKRLGLGGRGDAARL